MAVSKGDFVVVTGPNGAGKTTLLMSMAGAIPHYYGGTMEGMVFTGGKAVTQHTIADLASSIGVILSDYKAQIVTLTVGEEMAFTLETTDSRLMKSAADRRKLWPRFTWTDWRNGRFPPFPAASASVWWWLRCWRKSRKYWYSMNRPLRWIRKASVNFMKWWAN